MDWGHLGTLEEEGRQHQLWGFTFTLGYSRIMMAEAALDQKLGTLLRMHEEAFAAQNRRALDRSGPFCEALTDMRERGLMNRAVWRLPLVGEGGVVGGENSTGEMRKFHPALTYGHVAAVDP